MRLLQITLLVASCAICVVALADLGRLATQSDRPETALSLAPLNANVRMALIGAWLLEPDRLAATEDLALTGQAMHRADGRFDSVLGMIAHERGDLVAAQLHFEAARAKQPTEFQALRHLMVYYASDDRWADAAHLASVFAQRWRAHWRDHEQVMLVMADDPAGGEALIDSLAVSQPGRDLMIGSLLRTNRTLVAGEFLAAWQALGVDDLGGAARRVTQRLIDEGRVETALLLDQVTLGAKRPPPQGFVNNGRFAFEPSGSAFDWTVRPQQGVSFEWHGQTESDPTQDAPAAELEKMSFVRLQFRDSPLRLDNLTQVLVMRPGRHRLDALARAVGLRTPQPLQILVRCGQAKIAELVLDPLTEDWAGFAAVFEVPSDCPVQTISVSNGFMPLTWSSRYQGALEIGQLQIVGLP